MFTTHNVALATNASLGTSEITVRSEWWHDHKSDGYHKSDLPRGRRERRGDVLHPVREVIHSERVTAVSVLQKWDTLAV